jgi:serine/threonine-protein kinase
MADALRDRVEAALGASYALEAEIGRGGMGVVYRARDTKLRRFVAIKVLPPDLAFRDEVRMRFLREAETAAQLNHPNIVPIYSVDDRDGLVWFVMALVDGESLGARLARERRPPLDDVRHILHDVADALAYAHARGIIHRDIKPDNILLDRLTARPMVTDFGIARAVEGDSRLTVTGSAVGTPAYMSPEQATGEREIDGRSDIYSLAIVGYQMLSGELPFQAANTPSMLMKHISEPVPPLGRLRDVPPMLASTVERALAKKPTDRWKDAAEFRDAIAASANEPTRSAPLPPEPATADRHSASWKRPSVPMPPQAALPPAPRRGRDIRDDARERGRRMRDAIEASNAGYESAPDAPPREEISGPLAPMPPWMPDSWRDARRQWRGGDRNQRGRARRERLADSLQHFGELSREDKIRRFRRRSASTVITVGMLAGVNFMFSPHVPWFLFPAAFMSLGLLHRGAALWADGVRLRDIFGRAARDKLQESAVGSGGPSQRALAPPSVSELAERLAPADVIAGPYGAVVRRAAGDQAAALEALAKLTPADRALIPDVAPTVKALAERVGSLAGAMHRMDEDITPATLGALERRIAETKSQAESPERDRKLALLERQHATMNELLQRRDTLNTQLESAALLLQNMRLDLLALGSAGMQATINDVSTATQEARALSRDIQIALEAAREVR